MKPYLDDGDVRLFLGDCVEVMAGMEAESVDAVVTDPPYNLEFMGKGWDRGLPDPAAWSEALRVLRPGGHLLAFGGTRTFHRLTCAIEDAGFEVRDCLSWLYGSGFPKSLDVGKAIDRAAGAAREVVGPPPWGLNRKPNAQMPGDSAALISTHDGSGPLGPHPGITAPATPEAERWQGWGTALKPAWEPIVLARKPLAGTVAGNVLAHGTGALNVDGCRVEGAYDSSVGGDPVIDNTVYGKGLGVGNGSHPAGRWPANVVLSHTPDCREVGTRKVRGSRIDKPCESDEMQSGYSGKLGGHRPARGIGDPDGTETVPAFDCSPDCPVRQLDEAVGEARSSGIYNASGDPALTPRGIGLPGSGVPGSMYADTGGPSRFFYTAKASRDERDGATHPTVKPLALMRWLVRMVTPPGGLVLDPFAGSGTTLLAARDEGMRAIGIERESEYAQMAAHRLRQLSLLGELHED